MQFIPNSSESKSNESPGLGKEAKQPKGHIQEEAKNVNTSATELYSKTKTSKSSTKKSPQVTNVNYAHSNSDTSKTSLTLSKYADIEEVPSERRTTSDNVKQGIVRKKGVKNLSITAANVGDVTQNALNKSKLKLDINPETTSLLKNAKLYQLDIQKQQEAILLPNITISSQSVKFNDPSQTGLTVVTANVGLDGGLSQLGKDLKERGSENKYLSDSLTLLSQSFNSLDKNKLQSAPFKSFNEDLTKLVQLKDISDQKQTLINLASFLVNLDNRKLMDEVFFVNDKSQNTLSHLNKAIFSLYNLAMVRERLDIEFPEGAENKPTLKKYIEMKESQIIDAKVNEIKDLQLCFFQEFYPESIFGEKLKASQDKNVNIYSTVPLEPSLMISLDRFEPHQLDPVKQPREERTFLMDKTPREYCSSKMQIVSSEGKLKTSTFKIFDDMSFGSDQFRAVVALDKVTGRKMLLCSVHVEGYGLGKVLEHNKRTETVRVIHQIIEKIASDNDVDGIVIGGDFNSVEEKVGDAKSPLKSLKQAKFTQVKVKGNTEVAPPLFFQGGYELERRIDHFFIKWIGQKGDMKATQADIRSYEKDPLEQHKTAFDHAHLVTEIKIPLSKEKAKELKENEKNLKAKNKI